MDIRKKFNENGYVILKNFFSDNFVIKSKNILDNLEPKVFYPFSNEAWGFGDLSAIDPFSEFTEEKFTNQLEFLTNQSMTINHLVVNRKPAWIGPEVEFHQEVFNRNTFASGADLSIIKEGWIQIYMPLDDESPSNGGLRIVKNSHLLGALEYEDFVSPNFTHKRRVKNCVLTEIINKDECELIDLNLKSGDLLLFSPLLIHSSPSNGSQFSRSSIVAQGRPKLFQKDENIFIQETNFRKKFVQDFLASKSQSIENNLSYQIFKKD